MSARSSTSEPFLPQQEEAPGESSRDMQSKAQLRMAGHYRSLYTLTTAMGIGLIVLVLSWILHFRGGFGSQSDPKQEFYWHPFLMVLGMVFLYSQAILIYRTFRDDSKNTVKKVHASLHFVALILAIVGLKVAFDSHNLPSDRTPNLYSLHSWIGLTTVLIFATQYLFGLVVLLLPGRSDSIREAFLPLHTAVGRGGFLLALATTVTGMTEKGLWVIKDYEKLPAEGVVVNFMAVLTVLYGGMVLYLVNEPGYKRESSAPEQERIAAASE